MEDRHTYDYSVDTESRSAPAHVLRLAGEDKRVLELGCGPGSITKLLAARGCSIVGVEIDPDAIKRVSSHCERVVQANLNEESWPTSVGLTEKFDVVIAADVLEHLYNPWDVLKKMSTFVSDNGYLVVSLPHAGHAAIISCLLSGDFQYRDWGLLDRTHIRFFCLKNIEDLFSRAGLKILDFHYVITPPEATEFSDAWENISPSLRREIGKIKHSSIYQVVVKAVPSEREGLSLVLAPPEASVRAEISSFRYRAGAWMGPSWRRRAHRILNSLGIKI